MRIRMRRQITGTRDGVDWPAPGGEMVVPDDEGAQLCAMGAALPVAEERTEETRAPRRARSRGVAQ